MLCLCLPICIWFVFELQEKLGAKKNRYIFVIEVACTGRSIVITQEAREPSQYWVVKNHEEYHFELVNKSNFFCFYDYDIIKSNEWAINQVQANFSPGLYCPGNIQEQLSNSVSQKRCSSKFRKIYKTVPVPDFHFNKAAGLQPATLLKGRLQQRCFPIFENL